MDETIESVPPRWLDLGALTELSATTDVLPHLGETAVVPAPIKAAPAAEEVAPSREGRYGILGKLGEGGMGAVYLARESNLRRRVALKQAKGVGRESLARFVTEAQITAQLDHPGVVPVYALEVDAEGGVAYTMKPVEGDTLGERIERAKARFTEIGRRDAALRRDLGALLEAFVRVCESIDFAHQRGVIHRDLKPDNIMLGAHHEVYVMDWGLAKVIGAPADANEAGIDLGPPEDASSVHQSVQGAIKGTPLYMAPEQAAGRVNDLTPAADIYALGLILYELVYLQHGRSATSMREAVDRARANRRELPPAALDDSIELSAIMALATRTEPGERYASAMDLGRDVRRVLLRKETRALPDRGWRKVRRWISHHPQLAALVMAVTLGLVALGVAWEVHRQSLAAARSRLETARRERVVADLVSQVGARTSQAAIRFQQIGALTVGIAARASQLVSQDDAGEAPLLAPAVFATPQTAPPESRPAARYGGRLVSPRQAIGAGPPGAQIEHDLRLLRQLTGELRACFVPPGVRLSNAPRVDQAILGHELPIEWAYAALERSGVIAVFPGSTSIWGPDYDPRQRPWYREGVSAYLREGQLRNWSTPYRDLMGQGLVVTCTQIILDEEGGILGVAAVDVSFGELVKQVLTFADLPGFQRASLLDSQGRVLLATDAEPVADAQGSLVLTVYPDPEVVSAVQSKTSSLVHRQDPDGEERVLVWSVFPRLGWALLVEADARSMGAPATPR